MIRADEAIKITCSVDIVTSIMYEFDKCVRKVAGEGGRSMYCDFSRSQYNAFVSVPEKFELLKTRVAELGYTLSPDGTTYRRWEMSW